MNWSQPRFEPACGDKQRCVTQHAGTQRMEVNGEMESCNWSMYNIFFKQTQRMQPCVEEEEE